MRRLRSDAIVLAAGLTMFSMVPVLAADQGAGTSRPAHMEMTDDGPILATPSGMTLYTNGPDDNTPGRSQCSNVPKKTYADQQGGLGEVPVIGADIQKSCAQKWPPYVADEHAQPSGDFSLIDRPEGGKQWTFRAHPLYLSIRDHKPGDRNGVGAGLFGGGGGRGFRLAAVPLDLPAGLKLISREEGLTLATANNRPIYTPDGGRVAKVCAGCDEELFQTVLAPAIATVNGDWSIVDAGAGRHQYAFKGHALYRAPEGMTDQEIAQAGGWQTVVFRKDPGAPREIRTHMSLIGEVYTDTDGHTLYTYNCTAPTRDGVRCDEPGDPAGYWVALCGDAKECARRWHPYLAPANARPIGEWSAVDITYPVFKENPGIIYPSDLPHVKVWAYRGTPLWTYYEDKEAGDIWGHSIKWILGSSFSALQVPGREVTEN
jgi:predicted lipoprotein with Yx(FWY)xxD motif